MNKKILTIICILIILIFSYCYICSIDSIPNNIIILEGDKLNLKIAAGLSLNNSKDDTVLTASNINKEKICTTGSTNLNLNELSARYGERIISRFIGNYNICYFFGDDIRIKNRI